MTRTSATLHTSSSYNGIIVPVHDPLAANNILPSHGEFDPKILIQQLEEHINDLARIGGAFGSKMVQILRWPWIVDLLYPDRTQLELPHLGKSDCFACIRTRIHEKPVQLPDPKPVLYWLYTVALEFFEKTASSRGVTLQLTPKLMSQNDLGPLPPQMVIEIHSRQGGPCVQLTVQNGGPYDERIILSRPLVEVRPQTTTIYGKPVAVKPNATKLYSVEEHRDCNDDRLSEVFEQLYPRTDSKWRVAAKKFSHKTMEDEERFLKGLVQACKAKDDAIYVSGEEDNRCRELVNRFPPEANEFLRHKIGQCNGSFSRGDARD